VRTKDLVRFIKARERHRHARESGTKILRPDPIIREFRFCNVRRNDDRVTKWVMSTFFDKWREHEFLWFALVVARLFNNEPTLTVIFDDILPFRPARMRKTLQKRAASGQKNFNAAYIVSTNGRAMDKVDYVIDCVLQPLWDKRTKITKALDTGHLANAHMVLLDEQGLGSFMAAQVLADLKYALPTRWEDFHTFAASGPGSRRGLNRAMGFEVDSPWREDKFRATLSTLRDAVNAGLDMDPLTAQDLQNCLCEFDKYERARLDEGRPKQKYTPFNAPWKE
jgi:hypothetical protein